MSVTELSKKLVKLEVQQRVLQNGKPLDLDKFSWCEETKTFSSGEDVLVIDFSGINHCTFRTGDGCTFRTGGNCTFKTGYDCTFDTGGSCTFKTGDGCTFRTDGGCTFKTGYDCTFDTGGSCTFDTGGSCTFDTFGNCTFDTFGNCTFKTGYDCTFDTGYNCTFKTGYDCTFRTGDRCTFRTDGGCTFITGSYCVVLQRDVYQVVELKEHKTTQLYPIGVKGYSVDGICSETGKEVIIADGILSYVLNKKGNVYKVKNHNEKNESYLIKDGDTYSHGDTLKEARESLRYKIGNRDKSEYENLTLDSVLTKEEAIKAYRVITGACEKGVRSFVESQENIKDEYTVKDIIELTENKYGNNEFKQFF